MQPLFWTNPQEAIKNAYGSTNKYILENAKQLGPGGSTAVTAIVVDGKDMWIANVGDSRAVLCERGAANQITVDHEPHTTNERQRIEQQGGFVTTFPGMILIVQLSHRCSLYFSVTLSFLVKPGMIVFAPLHNCIIWLLTGDVPRVNGQLAVARAFGDHSLKTHLSSEPDVRHVPINSSIEFVILASDGLWKVCTRTAHQPFPASVLQLLRILKYVCASTSWMPFQFVLSVLALIILTLLLSNKMSFG